MLWKPRKGFEREIFSIEPLNDSFINESIKKLNELQNKDFTLKDDFAIIEQILKPEEKQILNLIKLLYCIDFKKEIFLFLGIILESQINNIFADYVANNWQVPQSQNYFPNKIALERNFKDIIIKKSLSEKADQVQRFNIFNDTETSKTIQANIQSLSILRNYGGHNKPLNEFLEHLTIDCLDDEIKKVFSLLRDIKKAMEILHKNPPSTIT